MSCWLECETAQPPLWIKKVLFLQGRHTVIEVFTTRQKCDGVVNAGDSDAWLNRLWCTDCGADLPVAMPDFIVLRLKGSPLRELQYLTPPFFPLPIAVHRRVTVSTRAG